MNTMLALDIRVMMIPQLVALAIAQHDSRDTQRPETGSLRTYGDDPYYG